MHALRAARPADAPALAALAEATFRATFGAANRAADMDLHCAGSYGPARQAAELADPQLQTWVVEAPAGARPGPASAVGPLVAFAQLRRGGAAPTCLPAGRWAELARLYVDTAWQGRRVADALMGAAVEAAAAGGAEGLWLGVWEHNPRAIRFYWRQGFAVVGDHRFLLGDDPQRDLVMRRATPA